MLSILHNFIIDVRVRKTLSTSFLTRCGNYVSIKHKNDSASSYYCHLSNPTVKVGDEVKAGQPIGISGSSGKSSGPHLHVHLGYSGNKALEQIFADKKCAGRSRSDDDQEWHRCGN